MRRILVCFKVSHNYEDMLQKDWEHFEEFMKFTKRILSSYDESGAEYALRLKDELIASGEEVMLEGVTIDEGYNSLIYSHLFAVGFDNIYELHTDKLDFNPVSKAEIIAEFIGSNQYDLIFTGALGMTGGTGMFPVALASKLDIPCLDFVEDIEYESEGIVKAEYLIDGGSRTIQAALPVLCAIGNSRHPYLRVPTLRAKLNAKGKKAEEINVNAIRYPFEPAVSTGEVHRIPEKQVRMISSAEAVDLVNDLFGGTL